MPQLPFKDLNPRFSILCSQCAYLFWGACALLTFIAYGKYPGNGVVYLMFTAVSNGLLYLGFRKKAIFFDAAIGVFFWLGFWLKVTVRVGFMNGVFHDATGNFDGSGMAFDRALLVSSCGMFALIVVAIARGWIFSYEKTTIENMLPGLLGVYQRHRKMVLGLFVLIVLGVGISNIYFGIYQRGLVTRTILPYRLGGVFTWLLLFGMASFGAVMLHLEYVVNRSNSYLVAVLVLFEGFVSNVSLLSRGMILNSAAVFYGLLQNFRLHSIVIKFRFFAMVFVIFGVLFASSVFGVNYLRYSVSIYNAEKQSLPTSLGKLTINNPGEMSSQTNSLFLDRWIGIEGVMAVSSSKKTGWDLWRQGWQETYAEGGTSFYDLNLIQTPYSEMDASVNHFISLPGIIGFFFYAGSFSLLFGCMLLAGAIGAGVEIAAYKLGGRNLILCSLLAQVVAFRFTSFGYAPMQSYLLFGSIFLNLFLIYAAEKLLSRKRRVVSPF